eukprot:COSAG01_NODE_751_length_13837_cov_78.727981_8_plen_100_part_00
MVQLIQVKLTGAQVKLSTGAPGASPKVFLLFSLAAVDPSTREIDSVKSERLGAWLGAVQPYRWPSSILPAGCVTDSLCVLVREDPDSQPTCLYSSVVLS